MCPLLQILKKNIFIHINNGTVTIVYIFVKLSFIEGIENPKKTIYESKQLYRRFITNNPVVFVFYKHNRVVVYHLALSPLVDGYIRL